MSALCLVFFLCLWSIGSEYFHKVSDAKTPNYGTKGFYTSPTPVEPEGSLYFFGGQGQVLIQYADFWQYSIGKGQWRWVHGPTEPDQAEVNKQPYIFDADNLPGSRSAGSALVVDNENRFVILGGGSTFTPTTYSDVWEFSVQLMQWRLIRERNFHRAVIVNVGEFDPANTPADFMRDGGFHPLKTSYFPADDVFIDFIGGMGINQFVNQVWVYSHQRNEWMFVKGKIEWNDYVGHRNAIKGEDCNNLANIPSARAGHQSWVARDSLYVFGGGYVTDISAPYYSYADMWRFQIHETTWCWIAGPEEKNPPNEVAEKFRYGGNIPALRAGSTFWTGAGGSSSYFFMFGGAADDEFRGANDVWVFDLERNEWKYTNGTYDDYTTEFQNTVVPSWRVGSNSWTIPSTTDVYIFGGGVANFTEMTLNPIGDLWKYDKGEFSCFDYDRDDPMACSTHGTCSGPNKCDCDDNYEGDKCQTNSADQKSIRNAYIGMGVGIAVAAVGAASITVIVIVVILCCCPAATACLTRTATQTTKLNEEPEDYGTFKPKPDRVRPAEPQLEESVVVTGED